MKGAGPVGFEALLARMPRRFVKQAKAVEERARLRRERQARLLEMEFICGVEVMDSGWQEWQDTVADFSAR